MGKGSNPRPVDATKYRENWDRIFNKVQQAEWYDRRSRQLRDEAMAEVEDLLVEAEPDARYPVIDEHGHQDLT